MKPQINKFNQIKFEWFLFYRFWITQIPTYLKNFHHLYPFYARPSTRIDRQKPNFTRHTVNQIQPTHIHPLRDLRTPTKTFSLEYKWTLFSFYVQLLEVKKSPYLIPHGQFKAFFLVQSKDGTLFFNIGRVYKRWTNTYNLLLNLFFKHVNILLFSSKSFKQEVTAFNKQLNLIEQTLFKRATPYFYLQDAPYGAETLAMFTELENQGSNIAFITDFRYHEKNAFFLRKCNNYTLSLIPLTMNPWVVSYCIPTATTNIMLEYFFLKLLAFIKQYAVTKRYAEVKCLWQSF